MGFIGQGEPSSTKPSNRYVPLPVWWFSSDDAGRHAERLVKLQSVELGSLAGAEVAGCATVAGSFARFIADVSDEGTRTAQPVIKTPVMTRAPATTALAIRLS